MNRQQIMANCLQPAVNWVRKIGRQWAVVDPESGQVFMTVPLRKTKREAVDHARQILQATWKRLNDELHGGSRL